MKKYFNIAAIAVAALLALTACTPSEIKVEESFQMPENVVEVGKNVNKPGMTLPESSAYTIPADAETGEHGGPGAMATTAVDYSYYPEDKRPGEDKDEGMGTQVIIYRVIDGGVDQDFDVVDVCDADSLINIMIDNGVIKSGCEVLEFSASDGKGKLKLNELVPMYFRAKEEEVVACVVDTFIDNLMLESLELTVGDKEYGEMEFTREYDAT